MSEPFDIARGIANAVLYEGYLLYPYTASAQKNQMRWQFGVVVPKAYEAQRNGERGEQHTELLCDASDATKIDGLVRFLHVEARIIEAARDGGFEPVAELTVDGTRHLTFDQTVEREIPFSVSLRADANADANVSINVDPSATATVSANSSASVAIHFDAWEAIEELRAATGELAGRIVRRRWPLDGRIEASLAPVDGNAALQKLRVVLRNDSAVVAAAERGAALRTSFIASHTLLQISGGAFLSPIDVPDYAEIATAALANVGTWPVLMGDASADSQRSRVALSSPIILGDFPQVAEKTDTDHFDSTEIDELLKLSVLSLSDAERAEARATDPRARKIVDRAEAYGAADVFNVHDGNLRTEFLPEAWRDLAALPAAEGPYATLFPDPRNRRLIEPVVPGASDLDKLAAGGVEPFEQLPPAELIIGGVTVSKGSQVRLAPKRRADAWDTFLTGKVASVRAIHQDFEDKLYVAVTVDDDPASDLHDWYGRSFFFEPDEVEPLAGKPAEVKA